MLGAQMPEVVLACNQLGMGGTERGMALQARVLRDSDLDLRIASVGGAGPLRGVLEQAGLRVDVANHDLSRLTDIIRGADIVVHLRPGDAAPLLPEACRRARIPHMIDWNMFGQVDRSADEPGFACHLFISKTIALRYRERVRDHGAAFHDRHRVQYLPVDPRLRELAPDRERACARFGLDPQRPVVGRGGRADDTKWRNLLVDMIPLVIREVPDAQLLLVGATPAKVKRLQRRGVLDRCVLVDQQPDEELIAASYSACDVFVSASEIGESQGLAILEAMSLGVPVVTCSTPWADNAQIEFVEHGRSGLIANHPRPFAEAVAAVLQDRTLRDRLGTGARAAVSSQFDPVRLARQLEQLFTSILSGAPAPADWSPSPEDVEAFATEYARRQRLQYRPLSPLERLEAKRARLWETVDRMRRRLSVRPYSRRAPLSRY